MAAWGGTLAVSQLAGLIIVVGVACAAAGGWLLLRNRFPGAFLALCLPWALIPLSVPALALLAGAALSALGQTAGVAALVVLALVSVPGQLGNHGPLGQRIISDWSRPGR